MKLGIAFTETVELASMHNAVIYNLMKEIDIKGIVGVSREITHLPKDTLVFRVEDAFFNQGKTLDELRKIMEESTGCSITIEFSRKTIFKCSHLDK